MSYRFSGYDLRNFSIGGVALTETCGECNGSGKVQSRDFDDGKDFVTCHKCDGTKYDLTADGEKLLQLIAEKT